MPPEEEIEGEEVGSRLPRQKADQAAEGLSWGSGRGRKRVRGRKRETASRTSPPANREGKAARGVAHRRGAKAGSGDGGRKARATSLRPDRWKGLESQAQRPEVGGRRQRRDKSK